MGRTISGLWRKSRDRIQNLGNHEALGKLGDFTTTPRMILITYSRFAQRFIGSPTMTTVIDSEVQCILNEGRATAYKLLTEHHAQLTKLAQALLEHEQLNRAEFEALLSE